MLSQSSSWQYSWHSSMDAMNSPWYLVFSAISWHFSTVAKTLSTPSRDHGNISTSLRGCENNIIHWSQQLIVSPMLSRRHHHHRLLWQRQYLHIPPRMLVIYLHNSAVTKTSPSYLGISVVFTYLRGGEDIITAFCYREYFILQYLIASVNKVWI